MNYATLAEAFNVETFDKKKKKKEKSEDNNDINIEEYKKDFSHCEPIQPPHFKLPVSGKAMEKYNDAYQVFLKDRKINENKNYNKNDIINTVNNNSNSKSSINLYENYDKIKNDKIDSIQPYYDEDLDNYLNLSDFNNNNVQMQKICDDDYKKTLMNYDYNLRTQDTFNHNKDDYVLVSKKDLMEFNNSLNIKNNDYKNAINKQEISNNPNNPNNPNNNSVNYNNTDNIPNRNNVINKIYEETIRPYDDMIINNPTRIIENYENINKTNNLYKTLINIAIFILIGIFIIYLLDLLTELALNRGMKKTLDTLLPLLEELKELKK
tara:strand:+ start:31913 stop:32881 length:969 start_codon:yes stop_codon:yes gene_type:complete